MEVTPVPEALSRLEQRFYQHVEKDEELDREISQKLDGIVGQIHTLEVRTLERIGLVEAGVAERIAKMEARVSRLETVSSVGAAVSMTALGGLLTLIFKALGH